MKIIGYKTPTSLWGGQVPKGELYIPSEWSTINYSWNKETGDEFNIAKEIVETWEAVYEFVVGKWYKNDSGYYAKLVNFENNILYCYELYTGLYRKHGVIYDFYPRTDWKEATIDEIQFFLPEGHPEKKVEYKVGDWVTVLDTLNVRSYNSDAIGYVFQIDAPGLCISRFLNGQAVSIDFKNKFSVNYLTTDIRKATKEEIEKAMEVDSIYVLPSFYGYNGTYNISTQVIEYGCIKFQLSELNELLIIFAVNQCLEGITVSGRYMTFEALESIKHFITNKCTKR